MIANLPSRTVRRILKELAQEGIIQKFGSTKGVRYLVINKPDFSEKMAVVKGSISSFFSAESMRAI